MGFKAAVFDLDGTLVHTASEYRYSVVNKTLSELGCASTKEAVNKFWFGADRDEIIKKYFNANPPEFWSIFKKYDLPEIRKEFTKPYGDIDFIEKLRKKRIKTGIVTGAPMDIASLEIAMIGKNLFDAIIIAQNSRGIKPKPHPHGLEECLAMLFVEKTEAVYIGNSDEDILTAKNAGVFDVFVLRNEDAKSTVKPSLIVRSLYELSKLF